MTDFLGYKNKRVVVSGCFSGMGEATTKRLLSLGAEVHGLDFKESKLSLASFSQIDLRDPASIETVAAKLGGVGKIDALFNCAGLPQTSSAMDVMKVNFAGTRHLTEKLLPFMSAGSAIASISSNGGMGWSRRIPVIMELLKTKGFEGAMQWCDANQETVAGGYAFSKEAVIVWTMLMSTPLIKQGIRINCTMPGPTQTPMMAHFEAASKASVLEAAMQPINRRSTPDEQAGPLVFLNSDAASYVNGICFNVDGGFLGGVTTGQVDLKAMMGG